MFSSEKVMLDYLGQLLNEEPEPIEAQQSVASIPVDEVAHEPVQGPSLRPISSNRTTPTQRIRPQLKSQSRVEAARPQFKEPEPVEPSVEAKTVEKLLQQVALKQQEEKIAKEQTRAVEVVSTQVAVEAAEATESATKSESKDVPSEAFQALFFEVAGLVLAVPLQELGGIHNLSEVNSLFGKPDWFKGVMVNREKKLNVVDSARWVMPEKYDDEMAETLNYQYLIMLDESNWGLAAEKLVETELIQPEDVKWRSQPGKRPWLLGTIKEKMCALLHVGDLIAMLEQGVNGQAR